MKFRSLLALFAVLGSFAEGAIPVPVNTVISLKNTGKFPTDQGQQFYTWSPLLPDEGAFTKQKAQVPPMGPVAPDSVLGDYKWSKSLQLSGTTIINILVSESNLLTDWPTPPLFTNHNSIQVPNVLKSQFPGQMWGNKHILTYCYTYLGNDNPAGTLIGAPQTYRYQLDTYRDLEFWQTSTVIQIDNEPPPVVTVSTNIEQLLVNTLPVSATQTERDAQFYNAWAYLLAQRNYQHSPDDINNNFLDDNWELKWYGALQEYSALSRYSDTDNDGLNSIAEFNRGSDPARVTVSSEAVGHLTTPQQDIAYLPGQDITLLIDVFDGSTPPQPLRKVPVLLKYLDTGHSEVDNKFAISSVLYADIDGRITAKIAGVSLPRWTELSFHIQAQAFEPSTADFNVAAPVATRNFNVRCLPASVTSSSGANLTYNVAHPSESPVGVTVAGSNGAVTSGVLVHFLVTDDGHHHSQTIDARTNDQGFAAISASQLNDFAGQTADIKASIFGEEGISFRISLAPVDFEIISGNNQELFSWQNRLPESMKVRVSSTSNGTTYPLKHFAVRISRDDSPNVALPIAYTDDNGFLELLPQAAPLPPVKIPEAFLYFQFATWSPYVASGVEFSHHFKSLYLKKIGGDEQHAEAGLGIPRPFLVQLTDESGAGIAGRTIRFTRSSVDYSDINTDKDGMASFLPSGEDVGDFYSYIATPLDVPNSFVSFNVFNDRAAPNFLSVARGWSFGEWFRADYGVNFPGKSWTNLVHRGEGLKVGNGQTFEKVEGQAISVSSSGTIHGENVGNPTQNISVFIVAKRFNPDSHVGTLFSRAGVNLQESGTSVPGWMTQKWGSTGGLTPFYFPGGTFHLLSLVDDRTTQRVSLDGRVVASGTATLAPITSPRDYEVSLAPSGGSIAEVLVFDRALTTSEQDSIETYLIDKYGLDKEQESPVAGLAGLKAWFRADQGVVAGSDGRVSSWKDHLNPAVIASQSVGSKRPFLLPQGIGGKPSIRFDGSNYLVTDTVDFLDPLTTTSADVPMTAFMVLAPTAPYAEFIFDYAQELSPYKGYSVILDANCAPVMSRSDAANQSINYLPGPVLSPGRPSVLSIRKWPGSIEYRANGVASSPAVRSAAYALLPPAPHPFGIGARADGVGRKYYGELSEMIIFNRRLSDEERNLVEADLRIRYQGRGGADTNANGIPDEWEYNSLGSLQSNTADPDGDGLNNLAEFNGGTDPLDFYNGIVPTISIVSGDNQKLPPLGNTTNNLVVQVSKPGGLPWPLAPVQFSVIDGGGTILNGSVPVGSTFLFKTDASGMARVNARFSASKWQPVTIEAKVNTSGTESQVFFTLLPREVDLSQAHVGEPNPYEGRGIAFVGGGDKPFVSPVDQISYVELPNTGAMLLPAGFPTPWFDRIQKNSVVIANAPGSATPTTVRNNPLVAFGGEVGGSPIYTFEPFEVVAYAGSERGETSECSIALYEKGAFTVPGAIAARTTVQFAIPRPSDVYNWANFAQAGFVDEHLIMDGNIPVVRLRVRLDPRLASSMSSVGISPSGLPLAIETTVLSDRYYGIFSLNGKPNGQALHDLSGAVVPLPMYAFSAVARPAWNIQLLSSPTFTAEPLPPEYYGKTLSFLAGPRPSLTCPVTQYVESTLDGVQVSSSATNLNSLTTEKWQELTSVDNSPELRSHPFLARFLAGMNANAAAPDEKVAMSLADYVINEVELTDAVGASEARYLGASSDPYSAAHNLDIEAINCSSLARGAMATLIEGQGSPVEQCSLLVYLLRKAGFPAVYMFPEPNTSKMFDAEMSRILGIQLVGATRADGTSISTPAAPQDLPTQALSGGRVFSLVTVNYPWVAVWVNGGWRHIFPWIKDPEVVDGGDIYKYLPDSYNSGSKLAEAYVRGNAEIMQMDDRNTPRYLLPKFLSRLLSAYAPDQSLSKLGFYTYNRKHYHTKWSDYAQPFSCSGMPKAYAKMADVLVAKRSSNLEIGDDGSLHQVPEWTNPFATAKIKVTSKTNASTVIETPEFPILEFHNRRLLIVQHPETTGANRVDLVGSAWSEECTGLPSGDFHPGVGISGPQKIGLSLPWSDSELTLEFTTRRVSHAPAEAQGDAGSIRITGAWQPYLGAQQAATITVVRPIHRGDLTSLCIDLGRVTKTMLNQHAEEYWRAQNAAHADNRDSIEPDLAFGLITQLIGMSYYEHVDEYSDWCEKLHRVHTVSHFAAGLSTLRPKIGLDGNPVLENGRVTYVQPSVDMMFSGGSIVANGTIHLEQQLDYELTRRNFNQVALIGQSAEEHIAVGQFFGDGSSVSTVRLLQLAEGNKPFGGLGVLELDSTNYVSQGQIVVNSHSIRDWLGGNQDGSIWKNVANSFLSSSSNPRGAETKVFITPGPVNNENCTYTGVAALIMNPDFAAGLIGSAPALNGAFGSSFPPLLTNLNNFSLYSLNSSIVPSDSGSFSFFTSSSVTPGLTLPPTSFTQSTSFAPQLSLLASPSTSLLSPVSQQYNSILSGQYNMGATLSNNVSYQNALGAFTQLNDRQLSSITPLAMPIADVNSSYRSDLSALKSDPVDVIHGELYVDDLDISLPGPFPLTIRRNYGSGNLAGGLMGPGWNISMVPFLTVLKTDDGTVKIMGLEMDGSSVKYSVSEGNSSTGEIYRPALIDNPEWRNHSGETAGSIANILNNRIVRTAGKSGSFLLGEELRLIGADGSKRLFVVKEFPISDRDDSGTYTIRRQHPYLVSWTDSRGNSLSFEYFGDKEGDDIHSPNYGQLARIRASNGNFVFFSYDTYGHIVQLASGDGRRVRYEYDDNGDLVKVVRPDGGWVLYDYFHGSQTVGPTAIGYSTHLISRITQPGGKVLENDYDEFRRVTTQRSSAGTDSRLVEIGRFSYLSEEGAPLIIPVGSTTQPTGKTVLTDADGHDTVYHYENGLITRAVDRLGSTTTTTWSGLEAAAGKFPRSILKSVDRRGLETVYTYDSKGNVLSTVQSGDLDGDGQVGESSVTSYTYTSNNSLSSKTEPNGLKTEYIYGQPGSPEEFLVKSKIHYASSAGTWQIISSDVMAYGNTGTSQPPFAKGMLTKQVLDSGLNESVTRYTYDTRGFLSNITVWPVSPDHPGSEDRNADSNLPLQTNYTVNQRGEITESVGANGAHNYFAYDDAGRAIWQELRAPDGSMVTSKYTYYDLSGNVTWEDGPSSELPDYLWNGYDGGGRLNQEIKWRIRAKAGAHSYGQAGVEPETGDNMYAVLLSRYDAQDRLTEKLDPRGNRVAYKYDPEGRMIQMDVFDGGNTNAPVSTETFSYEPGGNVGEHTDSRGGVTKTLYTSAGLRRWERAPNGSVTQWRYLPDGRLSTVISQSGTEVKYEYDVPNRSVSKTVKNASKQLGQEVVVSDAFGREISVQNALGLITKTSYDGIHRKRLIRSWGTSTAPPADDPENPADLRTIRIYYETAGLKVRTRDSLSNEEVTTFDLLGRPLVTTAYNGSVGQSVQRKLSQTYDDQGHVTTRQENGGPTVISWTDNDGRGVIEGQLSGGDVPLFQSTIFTYDKMGNLIAKEDPAGHRTQFAYDCMNRKTLEVGQDASLSSFQYNSGGDLLKRVVPGGVSWIAEYNGSGEITSEKLISGGLTTRTSAYSYFGSGPWTGLLQSKTDERGNVCSYGYDEFGRTSTYSVDGRLGVVRSLQKIYDAIGNLKTAEEKKIAGATVTVESKVERDYSAFNDLIAERVYQGSTLTRSLLQAHDSVGRRTELKVGPGIALVGGGAGVVEQFAYSSSGQLSSISVGNGSGMISPTTISYQYSSAGELIRRFSPWRDKSYTFDSLGRLSAQSCKVNQQLVASESETWLSDDKLLSYSSSFAGGASDTRTFGYDLSNRLISEPCRLSGATSLVSMRNEYDGKALAGPGVRTSVSIEGTSSAWTVGTPPALNLDAFQRPTAETMSGYYVSPMIKTTTGGAQNKVNTVSTFYDSAGSITRRSFGPKETQLLTWDEFGRLSQVSYRNGTSAGSFSGVNPKFGNSTGTDFVLTYDALGRRIRTAYTPVSVAANGTVTSTGNSAVVGSWYDPEVEFLEIGVELNGNRFWKAYGPDRTFPRGFLQGQGGLEAVVNEATGEWIGMLDDFWGNIYGYSSQGSGGWNVSWNPSKCGAYGLLPGSPFVQLESAISAPWTAFAWLGRRVDPTGFYYFGARYYEPASGRFVSTDPLGQNASTSLYDFSKGDPINGFDADGRCGLFATPSSSLFGISNQDYLSLVHPIIPEARDKIALPRLTVSTAQADTSRKTFNALLDIVLAVPMSIINDIATTFTGLNSDHIPVSKGERSVAAFNTAMNFVPVLEAAKVVAPALRVAEAAVTTEAASVAAQPNRIYSARELIRRAEEPGPFHNFPESFNQQIFDQGTQTVTPNFWRTAKPNLSNDSIMYKLPGSVNGMDGVFEIGVRPSASGNTEVIMHRFFRPNP